MADSVDPNVVKAIAAAKAAGVCGGTTSQEMPLASKQEPFSYETADPIMPLASQQNQQKFSYDEAPELPCAPSPVNKSSPPKSPDAPGR